MESKRTTRSLKSALKSRRTYVNTAIGSAIVFYMSFGIFMSFPFANTLEQLGIHGEAKYRYIEVISNVIGGAMLAELALLLVSLAMMTVLAKQSHTKEG